MLNKKASEEKLHNNSIIYNNRKPIEQRYKSHLRGADVPQGMNRNQSKPALQLPDIHNSAISKNNELEMQGQILNRNKKSVSNVHQQ